MKVSIIIPTYNRAYCIRRSIDSILAQTYKDFELIIVDDGSTDETEQIIAEYISSNPAIRYIKTPSNGGVSAARNLGMKEALGEYIAFQDSDDYWLPDKLEKQMSAIEASGADFSYTYVKYTLADNSTIIIPDPNTPLENMSGQIYQQLLHSNLVGAPTLLIHKRCYQTIGGFDTTLPALEDYDYALRLSQHFNAVFVSEPLILSTLSDNGVSANAVNHFSASCTLIGRYKKDLLTCNEFDYRVMVLINNAKKLGVENTVIKMLEKVLKG